MGYMELVREFPLRPIRDVDMYDKAASIMDKLIGDPKLIDDEDISDYVCVLDMLIEDYVQATNPELIYKKAPPSEVLRHLLESSDMTQTELSKESGVAISTVSGILSGKRGISPRSREAFAKVFNVKPSVFI